ncbi:MAG: winged helix-turn-helix transcriptional regulator [Clostridiales bacterium]|nr:winged helix-turn-helix transcriptional regulator [Clostridiales bacterium]MCF8023167.1 winged helix-turn-helix transcriptional regulator [Clostridiales bacterium]
MNNEHAILNFIEKNEETTQRKIARGTSLSPGAVNFLLKKMAKKGLVKLEKVNGRTMRYILTPQGMAEKARLTYRFMIRSYRQVIKINDAVKQIIDDYMGSGDKVVLYGPGDEILELIKIAAGNLNLKYEIASYDSSLEDIKGENTLVITWGPGDKSEPGVINIMDLL